jgi:phosphonate transport system substrate-binding protein
MRLALLLPALACFAVTIPAPGRSAPAARDGHAALLFGKVPSLNARDMISSHERLMRYLSSRLGGREVRFVLAPDYDQMARYLKDGQIDVGWLGPLNYPKAHEASGCEAILRVRRPRGDSYRGIIITRADSGIGSLKELKGHTFAFTEPSSASGYFYPRLALLLAGVNPDRDLKARCLKGHDKVVYNVFLGKFDAGAVYDDARDKLAGPEQRRRIVVLAKTKPIPNEPIVVRKGLDPALIKDLKAALLALDDSRPEDKGILGGTGDVAGFVAAGDGDYDQVREDIRLYENSLGIGKAGAVR